MTHFAEYAQVAGRANIMGAFDLNLDEQQKDARFPGKVTIGVVRRVLAVARAAFNILPMTTLGGLSLGTAAIGIVALPFTALGSAATQNGAAITVNLVTVGIGLSIAGALAIVSPVYLLTGVADIVWPEANIGHAFSAAMERE